MWVTDKGAPNGFQTRLWQGEVGVIGGRITRSLIVLA